MLKGSSHYGNRVKDQIIIQSTSELHVPGLGSDYRWAGSSPTSCSKSSQSVSQSVLVAMEKEMSIGRKIFPFLHLTKVSFIHCWIGKKVRGVRG